MRCSELLRASCFQKNQQIVSPEQFDGHFREQALIAEFPNEDAEAEYERRDSFLIHLIRREVTEHFGPESGDSPFVGDDWWPDHTRHMEGVHRRNDVS